MTSTGLNQFASDEPLDEEQLRAAPVRLPRPSRLAQPLDAPGPRAARALETLGVETVGALLHHLPRASGEARTIAGLVEEETSTVLVEVRSITSRPVRRRGMRPMVEATVADQTGTLRVVFFNQPWLVDRYRPPTRLMLTGRLGPRSFRVSGHAPTTQQIAGAEHVVQYPASEGIGSVQLLALAQEHRDAIFDVPEPLPAAVRVEDELPDVQAALTAVHFPSRERDAVEGRRRLAYDELLLLQLGLLRRRAARERRSRAPRLDGPRELSARWLESGLPFAPTDDQTAAMEAIDGDLARDHAMQRLLMGEVGSGKTVVALFTLLRAVEQGWQGALMAPTETLAEQHFATIQALTANENLQVALLTGSTPAARRRDLLGKLASGELALIVGTHALIEDAVVFTRLGAVVVDEQHRFGVRQRAALDAKAPAGLTPHVLHMTATPIPRTLALVQHGDLDHTALRQLPRGRQPIETHLASGERARERAYERIREELRAGRQAFVVCPLVGESEALQARAATEEYERLKRTEFRDFRVVLMHGQMKPREKQEAMADFSAGGADVLVATSVIEVGIDVPNATVMLVEDAERYGISQLHQLRGRIGRGQHKSLCLLFGPRDSARLRALAAHSDGFRLAQIDLELRREGEIVGVRQHGEAAYRIAILPDDADLLEKAHFRAETLLADDPELERPEHALLRDALAQVFGPEAMAPIAA
ncbi:ATP-dependent DNA helicase RecG [Conexibacter sp. JD483]|uniref:ATP-dependent DNA helicase RecG n=1 Tax=unclassified Conexibacter TaxID=2627773 RepID=UPI0027242690|nr:MULTISPECIES: ATP-dependent DNA helicase RecG [unclassified Conexibacter]MDO8184546.1 ATP-dependent DNA helicase RecG [Conexibacter sp. CPCC 205706]MDO8197852.1 ATP-dependent DNA helicase RecG [Conexibacter sp. CPCC 205762]MDR9369258.1 ATP-dependent DNA helicase RecG [Conexibacter sp. JD483]